MTYFILSSTAMNSKSTEDNQNRGIHLHILGLHVVYDVIESHDNALIG